MSSCLFVFLLCVCAAVAADVGHARGRNGGGVLCNSLNVLRCRNLHKKKTHFLFVTETSIKTMQSENCGKFFVTKKGRAG